MFASRTYLGVELFVRRMRFVGVKIEFGRRDCDFAGNRDEAGDELAIGRIDGSFCNKASFLVAKVAQERQSYFCAAPCGGGGAQTRQNGKKRKTRAADCTQQTIKLALTLTLLAWRIGLIGQLGLVDELAAGSCRLRRLWRVRKLQATRRWLFAKFSAAYHFVRELFELALPIVF